MSGLRVIPTRRHGQERLYVCLPDGRNIAWYDREAARVNLISDDHKDDVLEVLAPFLTGPVTVGPPPVPTPPPSTTTSGSRARPSCSSEASCWTEQ